MPFPFDKYPWLNFQELNLAYFIKHFREIFEQWNTLLNEMYAWKDATDAELEEWKSTVETGISSWETGLQQSMEAWKDETEADISAWEAATLAALDTWKTATTAVFEQIRTEAAASATAAAGSASSAQTALAGAQAAQAAAEAAAAGIQSELTQIQTNTADISELKTQLSNVIESCRIVGTGNTFANSDSTIKLIPGENYRIYINEWDTTGIPSTAGVYLARFGYTAEESTSYISGVLTTQTLSDHYDIHIPEDVVNPIFAAGGRVATGKIALLSIANIDTEDSIKGLNKVSDIAGIATFNGADATYFNDTSYFALKPGSKYRVYINSWDVSNVPPTAFVTLARFGYTDDGENVYKITVFCNQTLEEYYEFEVPNEAINPLFTMGGRAHFSTLAQVTVVNVNYEKEINNILTTLDNNINNNTAKITRLDAENVYMISKNHSVKAINHRGWYNAPENTLTAYKESRQRGFVYVETDVRFTSDGVAVLLHDETINRTARNNDGTQLSETKYIADITYEQALEYDFGIYKGAQYAGTRITTLDEFLSYCKKAELHPYIELKANPVADVYNKVKDYSLEKITTFIGGSIVLRTIKTLDETARLGIVSNESTQAVVDVTASLKTGKNDVFLDDTIYTNELVEKCKTAGIGLEIWTINNDSAILNMNGYISGVTSDNKNASMILYENAIT